LISDSYVDSIVAEASSADNTESLLVNKTNGCTEIQFYCYYDSTCFGQPFCPSSGVLSQTSALVHFMLKYCKQGRVTNVYKCINVKIQSI